MEEELHRALEQIRDGEINMGSERWHKCFENGIADCDQTDALYFKHDLALVLFEAGLAQHASHIDQQILDELDEDENREWPKILPVDRVDLANMILAKYPVEAGLSEHSRQGHADTPQGVSSGEAVRSSVSQIPGNFNSKESGATSFSTGEGLDQRTRVIAPETHVRVSRIGFANNTGKRDGTRSQVQDTSSSSVLPTGIQSPRGSQLSSKEPNTASTNDLQCDSTGFLTPGVATIESSTWLAKFDRASRDLESIPLIGRKGSQIGIAILDTGCNLSNPYFLSHGIEDADKVREQWHDCLRESAEPIDQDAMYHGTALAVLLIQLARNASICVIRVARDSKGLLSATSAIADAIRFAVSWGADVISMSFGFDKEVPAIRDAIAEAEIAKSGKILFFAAANNDGLNQPERFPAFSESVISVRGTFPDGSFVPLYNPLAWAHKAGLQYGTLAKDVPCGFFDPKSGCSVATPIMAAIAAIIIDFVEREGSFSQLERDLVRTRRGILSTFRNMVDGQNEASERMYVTPWQLFENGRRPLYLIGSSLSSIPQQH